MRLWVMLALTLPALVGCHHHGPMWPAALPDHALTAAVDQCVAFGATLDDGSSGAPMASHAPRSAHILAARCVDASVCAVELKPTVTGDAVVVHALRAGRSTVDVVYEEKPGGRRAEGRVEVAFEPLPPAPPPPRMPARRTPCPPIAPTSVAPWPGN